MKKSELRQMIREIIKEELSQTRRLIGESFESQKMRELYKYMKDSVYFFPSSFFSSVSKKYNIKWDKVSDDAITVVKNAKNYKPQKNELCFWVNLNEKETKLGSLYSGITAVTLGNTVLNRQGESVKQALKQPKLKDVFKIPAGNAGFSVGRKLLKTIKDIKKYSDIVYVVDLNKITNFNN